MVAKGAKVLVVEEAVEAPEDVTMILVKDTRYAMAFISAAYFGYPAEKLKTIGITGTKGKPPPPIWLNPFWKMLAIK